MGKQRILIVSNRVPYPLNDGGSLAIHAMLEGYHKAGWEVYFFSMNTSRHYAPVNELPPLYRQIGFVTFDIDTNVRLMPTLRNFFFSRKPNHVDRFYDKNFASKLQSVLSMFEPDFVQLESLYLATYIPVIREQAQATVTLRLHNIEYQIWERLSGDLSTSFKKFYLKDLAARIRKFEQYAWKQADVLLPITQSDAEIVRATGVDKPLIVAPFGIRRSQKRATSKEQWVGYHIGAMDWIPNAEAITWFLEEVWPELYKQQPGFQFHFAGRNMPGSFQKYEHDGVTCAGEVADADDFIADKKILIVPLHSGGGVRIKILEAMAAGKLVISTSIGMQGIDGVQAGKHYLQAETTEEFIAAVNWVLKHKEEAQAMAGTASEVVLEFYDQEKIMDRIVNGLQQIRVDRNMNI